MKSLNWIVFSLAIVLAISLRGIPDIITASAALNENKKIIVIDPGHGGEDGGTGGRSGALEKNINLDISLVLAELFEDSGYKVILTRDGDYSIGDQSISTIAGRKASDIKKRVEICNSSGAELVLSIHQNFFEQSKYYGTQVFYGANNDSEELAESIQLRVRGDMQPENSREVKPGGESIYLLRNAVPPSVIVECGFLSNAEEEKRLSDYDYQRKLAYSIFLGAVEYLHK